jgi:phosphoribosylformylglycinamidine (FGAM) synthase PurS component
MAAVRMADQLLANPVIEQFEVGAARVLKQMEAAR